MTEETLASWTVAGLAAVQIIDRFVPRPDLLNFRSTDMTAPQTPTPQPFTNGLTITEYVQQAMVFVSVIGTTGLASWLVRHGIDAAAAAGLAGCIVAIVGSFVWSAYQRITLKNLPAPGQATLTVVAPTVEKLAETAAKTTKPLSDVESIRIGSGLKLLVVGLLLVGLTGCAATPAQKLLVAETTIRAAQDTWTGMLVNKTVTDRATILAGSAAITFGSTTVGKAYQASLHPTTQAADGSTIDQFAQWTDTAVDAATLVTKTIAQIRAEKAKP